MCNVALNMLKIIKPKKDKEEREMKKLWESILSLEFILKEDNIIHEDDLLGRILVDVKKMITWKKMNYISGG